MQPSQPPYPVRCIIAGEAGDGIMTAGGLLLQSIAHQGFEASVAKSFPSNIRGGYAQSSVTISDTPVVSPIGECDILFSLSDDAFLLDTIHLKPSALVLVESSVLKRTECARRGNGLKASGSALFAVPVRQIARETAGSSTIRSTVATGILGEVLGIREDLLYGAVEKRFAAKSAEILELNRIALESGLLWARQHLTGIERYTLPSAPLSADPTEHRLILEGNFAVALGAIHAGCSFYASYPITPATAIGETLARELPARNGFAYQAEDEIAALGTVIGASFVGAKAMTATSGPGLSLMQEFIGYASMVELPVVIVDVQRAGPSTGMPTKHSQDDLHAAVFGGHGEDQRIVLAPQSVEDCFGTTVDAFNCAERYQCPVLLLSDSTLGMTKTTVSRDALKSPPIINRTILHNADSSDPYRRYVHTESGAPPMAVPGISPVTYRATGVEHGDNSAPVATPAQRTLQMERRQRKLHNIQNELPDAVVWDAGNDNDEPVDVCICAWGFTASICRETVYRLRRQGYRICAVYPRLLYPVCTEAIHRWAQRCTLQVVVENNHSGQYGLLLRMFTDARPVPVRLSSGEPFSPEEIESRVIELLSANKDGN